MEESKGPQFTVTINNRNHDPALMWEVIKMAFEENGVKVHDFKRGIVKSIEKPNGSLILVFE